MCVVTGEGHIWPWKPDGYNWGLNFKQYVCFNFKAIRPYWLTYCKFHIWPWKFEVNVMAKVKVKPDGHIWGIEFNRYVGFSFHGNQTILCWDIANSIFDIENSRCRSLRKPTKSNQIIYRSGPTIVPKMKEIQKVVQKLSWEQQSAASGAAIRTGTHSRPCILGWLKYVNVEIFFGDDCDGNSKLALQQWHVRQVRVKLIKAEKCT